MRRNVRARKVARKEERWRTRERRIETEKPAGASGKAYEKGIRFVSRKRERLNGELRTKD